MGATSFPIHNEPYGDAGRRTVALIRCSVCFREDKVTLGDRTGGWAFRTFKERGWLLGRTRATDVCSGCRHQKPPMAGPSTPARRRAAYLAIEDRKAASAKAALMGSAMKTEERPRAGPLAEALAPLLERMTSEGIAPQEDVMMTDQTNPAAEPGGPPLWFGGYKTAESAAVSAQRVFRETVIGSRPRRDVDFECGLVPDGSFAWRHKTDERPDGFEVILTAGAGGPRSGAVLSPDATYAAASAARRAAADLLKRIGVQNAVEGVHFVIEGRDHHRFGFKLNGVHVGDKPATNGEAVEQASASWAKPEPTVAEREAALGLPPSQPREITRDDRRRIREALDTLYDVDAGRYRNAMSDAQLADRMDLPRAWVERIRLDDYGDYDRNEAAERQIADIDKAILDAKAATEALLDSATKAETILQGLEALRRKLGGA